METPHEETQEPKKDYNALALEMHEKLKGKLEVISKKKL